MNDLKCLFMYDFAILGKWAEIFWLLKCLIVIDI